MADYGRGDIYFVKSLLGQGGPSDFERWECAAVIERGDIVTVGAGKVTKMGDNPATGVYGLAMENGTTGVEIDVLPTDSWLVFRGQYASTAPTIGGTVGLDLVTGVCKFGTALTTNPWGKVLAVDETTGVTTCDVMFPTGRSGKKIGAL
jgi:hypothetical protein